MSEHKRRRVTEDARRLELCADDLRELGASIGSCSFRTPSTSSLVSLKPSEPTAKSRNRPLKSPSPSLYSVVSSAAFAAKTNASSRQDTWQEALERLTKEMDEASGSSDASERLNRLQRRYESLSASVRVCQEKVRKTGDEVALQDRVESHLAQEETAWEQQMQIREEKVAEKEVELKALQEENAAEDSPDQEEEEQDADDEEAEAEIAELQEVLALRAEEKRDIEAAIDSLQRKKKRRSMAPVEKREDVGMEADAAAAAREQVLRELRDEKDALQREIIAAEELEEKQEENARDLPALKEEVSEAKYQKAKIQAQVDSLRLELARRKRKMRHMVDVQLLTARDTNPPTLREEAVLLHLLYEHEGEMGVNELKQEASTVLQEHGKPNGNGVVIRALYSLVANGVVQIDRSYGNGLVTSLLV
ncbi:hypothetical protein PHYBOEH_004321 [Phytophthora boehmeriae]|uniref:Uncharacterized protein n=1 Tax=Phytophthora boehmeriae TaxID=109152 RepID=A0A8T1X401_9STRA|nr:hypothetical protein PHYBOEH_004321 [Phytophthora boehmeriae]